MDSEYKLSSYEKGFVTKERGNDFRVEQDVQHYKDYAASMREKDKYMTGARETTFRPFCIIPDVVAIDLKVRYGIDVHANEFLNNPETKAKFAHIMRTEFPELLTSAAANLTNTGGGNGIIIT